MSLYMDTYVTLYGHLCHFIWTPMSLYIGHLCHFIWTPMSLYMDTYVSYTGNFKSSEQRIFLQLSVRHNLENLTCAAGFPSLSWASF